MLCFFFQAVLEKQNNMAQRQNCLKLISFMMLCFKSTTPFTHKKQTNRKLQSNFSGSNTFGTMKNSSRQG